MLFPIVVAHDEKFGISKGSSLPWKISSDLRFFQLLTSRTLGTGYINSVVMGRRTWDSLPPANKPLPDRLNIVLSRHQLINLPAGVYHASSFSEVVKIVGTRNIGRAFVVGGGEIYKEALRRNLVDYIYATEVDGDFNCDTFLPNYKRQFRLLRHGDTLQEEGYSFHFNIYEYSSSIAP